MRIMEQECVGGSDKGKRSEAEGRTGGRGSGDEEKKKVQEGEDGDVEVSAGHKRRQGEG